MLGGFARLAGDFHGAMIELRDAVGHAELRELVAVGAEGIGFDELRAGFDVGLMNVEDGFAVRGVEFIHAALRAHGFVQQGAHGAVGDEDGAVQPFVEIFDTHALLVALSARPGAALPGPAACKKFIIIPFGRRGRRAVRWPRTPTAFTAETQRAQRKAGTWVSAWSVYPPFDRREGEPKMEVINRGSQSAKL